MPGAPPTVLRGKLGALPHGLAGVAALLLRTRLSSNGINGLYGHGFYGNGYGNGYGTLEIRHYSLSVDVHFFGILMHDGLIDDDRPE